MFISEIAIRRPVATVMFFVGVAMLGVISLTRLSVDLLPDLSYPKLTIRTSYSDVPPTEVEKLITMPIEEALSTVPRVRRLHSVSKEGISLVIAEFLWGTEMDIAALNVRGKLDNLRWNLPREAGRPTILRLDPRSQPILYLSVTGGELMALKSLSQNVFKRRLEQIDGVALAAVTGGFEREIQVEVDRQKLTAFGISIDEVTTALSNANRNLSGGTIRKGRYRFSLRTFGEFQQVPEIEDVVVFHHNKGSIITIKDIATVVDGFKDREAITRFNGKEAIGLILTKEAGTNTVEVSQRARQVIDQLREEYPEVTISVAADQATFISAAISNVLQAVVLGGILAFLVLFFFLHDLRNPVNIATAIPIAILATFAMMFFSRVSLNMVSLGGLALGVGMLVDNSIVVLENIFRHRQEGRDRVTAGFRGAREVAMPVTASTLTTIAVFFPIIYVKGVAGQLFRDQSLTVTFSLLASLLVSLTLLPMLASRFFYRSRNRIKPEKDHSQSSQIYRSLFEKKHFPAPKWIRTIQRVMVAPLRQIKAGFSGLWHWLVGWIRALVTFWLDGLSQAGTKLTKPLFRWSDSFFEKISQRYEHVLQWALNNRTKVFVFVTGALAIAALVGFTLDRRLMPRVDQRQFTIEVKMPPGTSLEMTANAVGGIEHRLLAQPDVASVYTQIGLASDQNTLLLKESALNRANIQVRLTEHGRSTGDFIAAMRNRFHSLVAGEITYQTGETVLSQFLGTSEFDVAIKVTGDDPDYSKELMDTIKKRIGSVKGLTDVHSSYEEGRPEIQITVDREMCGRFGLTARQVAEFVKHRMHGAVSTQFKDFDRKIDILVRPRTEQRDELADLLQSRIMVNKQRLPIRQFIQSEYTQGPVEILREDQARQVIVYANIRGRDFNEVIREIEHAINKIDVRYDYQVTVGGQREEMQRSFRSLILVFLLAVCLVYMILAAQFESLLHPFIILFAVPLALIGVVFTLLVTGQGFNIMSIIGIVVLVGIVVNDAIIKIDFINQGRKAGLPVRQAIKEAGKKRLRPILMTTVTTVLALLPMALGMGEGAELRRPLAIAVIGGLISATFLTLVVVPVLYSLVVKREEG